MIPTQSECFAYARKLIGDTEVASGQRFDDNFLRPFLETAYGEIFTVCQDNELPLIKKRNYWLLSAYFGTLYPATAGIGNFGELISLSERTPSIQATITDVTTPTSGVATVTTSAAHGFTSGQRVAHHGIVGFSDDINDEWVITVLTSTTYQINGTTATGAYDSGGVAVYSGEEFIELNELEAIPSTAPLSASALVNFAWDGDSFRFPGSSVERHLKIEYRLSSQLSSTDDTMGIDGCRDFIAYRTASLAMINDNPEQAKVYQDMALGEETGRADLLGAGGFLGNLIRPWIKSGQRLPLRRPPFRPDRNTARRVRGYW